jgi:hypothetical protein
VGKPVPRPNGFGRGTGAAEDELHTALADLEQLLGAGGDPAPSAWTTTASWSSGHPASGGPLFFADYYRQA